MAPKQDAPTFAACINNSEYPASLELHKIYQVVPDEGAAQDGDIRVVDESGEESEGLERLRAAVMLGHQQAMRGEVTTYSPELIQNLIQQAVDNKNRGKPVKNDIR